MSLCTAIANGNWNDSNTWSDANIPTDADTVEITGYQVTLTANLSGSTCPIQIVLTSGAVLEADNSYSITSSSSCSIYVNDTCTLQNITLSTGVSVEASSNGTVYIIAVVAASATLTTSVGATLALDLSGSSFSAYNFSGSGTADITVTGGDIGTVEATGDTNTITFTGSTLGSFNDGGYLLPALSFTGTGSVETLTLNTTDTLYIDNTTFQSVYIVEADSVTSYGGNVFNDGLTCTTTALTTWTAHSTDQYLGNLAIDGVTFTGDWVIIGNVSTTGTYVSTFEVSGTFDLTGTLTTSSSSDVVCGTWNLTGTMSLASASNLTLGATVNLRTRTSYIGVGSVLTVNYTGPIGQKSRLVNGV
jgi:hypothetical protein